MRQRKEGRERRLGEEVDELEEVVVVGTQIAVLQTVQDGRVLSCSLLPLCPAAGCRRGEARWRRGGSACSQPSDWISTAEMGTTARGRILTNTRRKGLRNKATAFRNSDALISR